MKRILHRKNGFTVVELLIVVVVIAILAALVIVGYNSIQTSARDKSLLSDIDGVDTEIGRFVASNGGFYTSALNWDSSSGSNANILFTPSSGNIITVTVNSDNTYCIKAYNPGSNSKTLATAVQKGTCLAPPSASLLSVGSGNATCAYISGTNIYCWGDNFTGQLGNLSGNNATTPVLFAMTGALAGKTLKTIAIGNNFACGIASDDKAYCWGNAFAGQLGNNSTSGPSLPVAVSTAGVLANKTIKAIDAAENAACAIASDDAVYCWGTNSYGQLGNNSYSGSLVPVAVSTSGALSGKTVKSISLGASTACAIASDNNAYCWGITDASTPTAVSTAGVLAGKTIKKISAGYNFACAIASDDNAYCWSDNTYGQLGNNSTTYSYFPVAVSTAGVLAGKTLTSIDVGNYHACVIDAAGKGYCWGTNSGRLGNNSSSNSLIPVAVHSTGALSGKTLSSIVAGRYHTCGMTTDTFVYCWGSNNDNQLGNGSTSTAIVPTAVTKPW